MRRLLRSARQMKNAKTIFRDCSKVKSFEGNYQAHPSTTMPSVACQQREPPAESVTEKGLTDDPITPLDRIRARFICQPRKTDGLFLPNKKAGEPLPQGSPSGHVSSPHVTASPTGEAGAAEYY